MEFTIYQIWQGRHEEGDASQMVFLPDGKDITEWLKDNHKSHWNYLGGDEVTITSELEENIDLLKSGFFQAL